MSTSQEFFKAAAIALIVSSSVGASLIVTADAAYAKPGNNGNGNANRSRGNSENGNRGNNGRGAIASELKGLNAAHANENALANAAPNSMPGQLGTYRDAQVEAASLIAEAETNEANTLAEFDRLVGLSEADIDAEFPNGGYEDAVSDAATAYGVAQEATAAAKDVEDESLLVLTGGRVLSDAAIAELNRLLGLF